MLTLCEIIFISPIQNYTRPDYDHIPLTYGIVPGLKPFTMSHRSENAFFMIILGFKPITLLPNLSFPLHPSTSPRQRQLFDLGT